MAFRVFETRPDPLAFRFRAQFRSFCILPIRILNRQSQNPISCSRHAIVTEPTGDVTSDDSFYLDNLAFLDDHTPPFELIAVLVQRPGEL